MVAKCLYLTKTKQKKHKTNKNKKYKRKHNLISLNFYEWSAVKLKMIVLSIKCKILLKVKQ